jgi:hypothetical protein
MLVSVTSAIRRGPALVFIQPLGDRACVQGCIDFPQLSKGELVPRSGGTANIVRNAARRPQRWETLIVEGAVDRQFLGADVYPRWKHRVAEAVESVRIYSPYLDRLT